MPPDKRKILIMRGAVKYFAEVGPEGQTRELAKRLGITQSLLFKYFPSKDDLISCVYEYVYVRQWDAAWEKLIGDQSATLDQRLMAFYAEYLETFYHHDTIRLYFYIAMRNPTIHRNYIRMIKHKIIDVVARQICALYGVAPDGSTEARAVELVWGLHSKILDIAIRRFIYGLPQATPLPTLLAELVHAFILGTGALRPVTNGRKARV